MLVYLRGALVAATVASVGYQVVAALAARRWRHRALADEGERGRGGEGARARPDDRPLSPSPSLPVHAVPPVSILKPVRGLEPHAERSFTSFCTQQYPEYELLFGVADASDPAAELVRSLAARYPAAHIRLVETNADLGPNRKVCNLHGLAAAARHEVLLISDSDMRVTPDYLRRVVAPFRDPRVGLVTCPYRGAEPEGVPAALEALGIAAGFMPGVFVAALGGAAFAFGSTTALRRETLERIGGFECLVEYLADDYQMGRRVADLGLRVQLSSVVVDSVLGHRSFCETWARRLRWARTVRACRPLGHLGSGLTHTTALALLMLAASSAGSSERKRESAKRSEGGEEGFQHGAGEPRLGRAADSGGGRAPGETRREHKRKDLPLMRSPCLRASVLDFLCLRNWPGGTLAAVALAVRLAAAWRVAVVELESEAARRWFPLLLVSDLVEAGLWFSSLFGRTVLWRGQRYRLLEGGRMERVKDEERQNAPRALPGTNRATRDDLFSRTQRVEAAAGALHIRPIRPGDERELLAFFRDRLSPRSQYLFCPHDPSQPERCLVQFAQHIQRHRKRKRLAYVVEQAGAIVGYVYLSGLDQAEGRPPTLGIGLADALHGQGIGGAMLDHLLDAARALGIPTVELTHESTNERAGRLYLSRGFIYTGAEERSGPDGARVERVMRWTSAAAHGRTSQCAPFPA